MGLAVRMRSAEVTLHIRCYGCMRESVMTIELSEEVDEEELQYSAELQNLAYQCSHCEGLIGHLFAINGVSADE